MRDKPALLIFKVLRNFRSEDMRKIRKEIIKQVEEGVVVLPYFINVETIIPSDCEIRIVDKDGNVVEGGKLNEL